MLQSPMIMMMGAVGVMVVALPYMMVRSPSAIRVRPQGLMTNRPVVQKNLDPEQLKEVQESQARVVKMQSSISSGDFSG